MGRQKKWDFLCFLFVNCCSICPQNTSFISANETTARDSMRLNPHIRYYSMVYVISMGAALLLKTIRGLVFVKVSHPSAGSLGGSAVWTGSVHLAADELQSDSAPFK